MSAHLICQLCRYLLAAVLTLTCLPCLAQDRQDACLTLQERAYIASRVYACLANFAHWQDTRDDIDASYQTYLEKALASEDRFAFSRASMEFVARLHNGHTIFLDLMLIQQGGSLPFAATFSGGKWVVTASQSADLKPGDVIESIDGRSFEDFYLARRPLMSASTEQWARHALFARLPVFTPYAHLFAERFVLGLAGGRQVTIDRKAMPAAPPSGTEGRWLEQGKVAYIRIPSFFSPEFEKRAVELVREFRGAAALIIDVRGNMGGNTPEELTSVLMDRPYRWWTESTPAILPYFRFRASQGGRQYEPFQSPEFSWRSPVRQPAKENFTGKVALLVDAGCNSACEDFAMPFKDNSRALLFGGITAGSTGQPYTLDLKNGMLISVGSKREAFPDGSRFEGMGIKPDVELEPTIEDTRDRRDPVLEAARKRLGGS